jgi:hypothetical protein
MGKLADHMGMTILIILIGLALIGPLAAAFGADSRDVYDDRPRAWWPGMPRP